MIDIKGIIQSISDNYVVVRQKYEKFYRVHQKIPIYFDSYNSTEIGDICITLTTRTGMAGGSGCVLVLTERK